MFGKFLLLSACLLPAMAVADTRVAETDFTGDYAVDMHGKTDKTVLRVKRYREDEASEKLKSRTQLQRARYEWVAQVFDTERPQSKPQEIVFERVEDKFYKDPELKSLYHDNGLICTGSTFLLLCHVEPESVVVKGKFSARTGYFAIKMHAGPIGLIKRVDQSFRAVKPELNGIRQEQIR